MITPSPSQEQPLSAKLRQLEQVRKSDPQCLEEVLPHDEVDMRLAPYEAVEVFCLDVEVYVQACTAWT